MCINFISFAQPYDILTFLGKINLNNKIVIYLLLIILNKKKGGSN